MSLGELIKKFRKSKKMSVYDVAKFVGISHSYLTQIENGKRKNPDIEILSKISVFLNLPVEEIINIKIKEFESFISINREAIIKASAGSNLDKKISLLTTEQKFMLEGYIDCLLHDKTSKLK